VDVDKLGVDMLSLSGHKVHGPKGIGALFVRKGTRVKAVEYGGGQEKGLRSGTMNVPGIVGMGQACEAATRDLNENVAHMTRLRDRLLDGLTKEEYVTLNGSGTKRSPNNVNVSFHYIEGESLVLMLDMKGVEVSTGSACSSKSLQPSHVILATGRSAEQAHGSIRFTNSKYNTDEEIEYVLEVLPDITQKLMAMSPLYKSR
jgi:cysteine desulfurase